MSATIRYGTEVIGYVERAPVSIGAAPGEWYAHTSSAYAPRATTGRTRRDAAASLARLVGIPPVSITVR